MFVVFFLYSTGHCLLAPSGEPLQTAVSVRTLGKASGGGVGGASRNNAYQPEATGALRLLFPPAFCNVDTNYLICCSKRNENEKMKQKSY